MAGALVTTLASSPHLGQNGRFPVLFGRLYKLVWQASGSVIGTSVRKSLRTLERFRADQLADTGQIGPGIALRLFAIAPLQRIAAPA